MVVTELDTFLKKFQQLWYGGHSAHLDLECHAGVAWVGVRVQLGPAPGPHHRVHPQFGPKKKEVSLSRIRRRERRAAERNVNKAEKAKSNVFEEEPIVIVTEDVTNEKISTSSVVQTFAKVVETNAVIEENIAEETTEDSAKNPQIINEIEKRILEKDKEIVRLSKALGKKDLESCKLTNLYL